MANPILIVPTTPSIIRALYASLAISGGSGNWNVGDEIEGDTSGAKAILILIENPGATATLHFNYIDPFIAFNGSEAISNNTDTGAATGSGATTLKAQDLDFSSCKNYKPLPDIQGGVIVRITVTVGSIQFSVNDEPGALSPVYTVDDVVWITIYKGNTLKMLGAADLDSCNLVL